MNLRDGRLAPAPGSDGLVCRTPGAVLFIAARMPAADVSTLLERVMGVTDAEPGRTLARSLASLVAGDDNASLPPFALVAATSAGVYVKAYGPIEVRLQGVSGEEVISAVGSFTGVDRELPGPFHTIIAHPAGQTPPAPAFDLDLQAGTAPGGGFALTVLAAPAETPAPMAAAPVAEAPTPAPEPAPAPMADPFTAPPEPSWTAPAAEAPPATLPPAAAPPVAAAALAAAPPVAAPPVVEAPAAVEPPAYEPPVSAPPAQEPPAAVEPPPYEPPVAPDPTFEAPAYEPPAETAPPPHEPATLAAPVADAAPAEFTSQLLGDLDDDDDVDEREALPVELDPAEVRAPEQATNEVLVQGVVCSRGHFNDPRSRFCSSCGISMVQNTQILTNGPRPPLGVMVFEDGATFSLSSDYVVGRQPESSPLVQSGDALPLQVDDPERSISRAHAELRLVDWDVHLVNLSETNGSFVWDPTSNQWIPIPAGQSVMLTPGMRVALGRRSAVFESSLVR